MIEIPTPDGAMPAFEERPGGEPRGAVVVIQEAFGLTDHIGRVTRRLADAGWHAVAPALFHRQGSPVLGYEEFDKVMPVMSQLDAEGLATDLGATLDHTAAAGFGPSATGMVGFCMGGTVTFFAATSQPIGAAVTFYGGGVATGRFGLPSLIDMAPELAAPWLGLYGDQDKGIPVDEVESLRHAVGAAEVETEVVRYPEAEHGFNCDDRPSFHPGSAADAWGRMLAWFEGHLTPAA